MKCPRIDVNTTVYSLYGAIKNKLTEHGWTGRQELHEQIVDDTVRTLRAKYKKYVYTEFLLAVPLVKYSLDTPREKGGIGEEKSLEKGIILVPTTSCW